MSPILMRPVREQLEHDRVIRLLQARWRRRYEVGVNIGAEETAAVGSGAAARYPDLVLYATERGRRLQAIVEVETAESVNNLEALAEWAPFARLKVPLHLYVPSGSADAARRLCTDNNIPVAEIWSYHAIADQMRFAPAYRAPAATAARRAAGRARTSTTARPQARGRTPAKPAGRSRKTKAVAKSARAQKRK